MILQAQDFFQHSNIFGLIFKVFKDVFWKDFFFLSIWKVHPDLILTLALAQTHNSEIIIIIIILRVTVVSFGSFYVNL